MNWWISLMYNEYCMKFLISAMFYRVGAYPFLSTRVIHQIWFLISGKCVAFLQLLTTTFIDRIRRMREGNMFSLFTPEGTPIQLTRGGVGYPHPVGWKGTPFWET